MQHQAKHVKLNEAAHVKQNYCYIHWCHMNDKKQLILETLN